jgi:hypothetical protein
MSANSNVQFTVYNHESGVNVFKILILLNELGLTYEFVTEFLTPPITLTEESYLIGNVSLTLESKSKRRSGMSR